MKFTLICTLASVLPASQAILPVLFNAARIVGGGISRVAGTGTARVAGTGTAHGAQTAGRSSLKKWGSRAVWATGGYYGHKYGSQYMNGQRQQAYEQGYGQGYNQGSYDGSQGSYGRKRREALDESAPIPDQMQFKTQQCDVACKNYFQNYIDQINDQFLINDNLGINNCFEIQIKNNPEEIDFITIDNRIDMKFQGIEFICLDEAGDEFDVSSDVLLSGEIGGFEVEHLNFDLN